MKILILTLALICFAHLNADYGASMPGNNTTNPGKSSNYPAQSPNINTPNPINNDAPSQNQDLPSASSPPNPNLTNQNNSIPNGIQKDP